MIVTNVVTPGTGKNLIFLPAVIIVNTIRNMETLLLNALGKYRLKYI